MEYIKTFSVCLGTAFAAIKVPSSVSENICFSPTTSTLLLPSVQSSLVDTCLIHIDDQAIRYKACRDGYAHHPPLEAEEELYCVNHIPQRVCLNDGIVRPIA